MKKTACTRIRAYVRWIYRCPDKRLKLSQPLAMFIWTAEYIPIGSLHGQRAFEECWRETDTARPGARAPARRGGNRPKSQLFKFDFDHIGSSIIVYLLYLLIGYCEDFSPQWLTSTRGIEVAQKSSVSSGAKAEWFDNSIIKSKLNHKINLPVLHYWRNIFAHPLSLA